MIIIIVHLNGKEYKLFNSVDKTTISSYYEIFMTNNMNSVINNIVNFADTTDLI
jgi:hypothetical protein